MLAFTFFFQKYYHCKCKEIFRIVKYNISLIIIRSCFDLFEMVIEVKESSNK